MKTVKKTSVIVGVLILVAYSMLASTFVNPIIGLFTEIISGAAVIGIAFFMYPLFKPYKLRSYYLLLKIVEGLLMFIAGVFILLQNKAMYDNIYAIHLYAFVISAFIFYYLLYKSKIIPQFISIWGIIAVVLLVIVNMLEMLINVIPIPLLIIGYSPIILNEVFLAGWLIVKGFDVKD